MRLYHMGEPLLHKQLSELIAYFTQKAEESRCEESCFHRMIGIMTNGILLDWEIALTLMETGIDAIGFSIDGRTPEKYEIIRRGSRYDLVSAT